MVQVVATHYVCHNENFSCSKCVLKHTEDRRNRLKGCASAIAKPVAKYKDRIAFYKCPSNFYSGYVAEIMAHARHIENGLLPYAGGLLDQPAKLIELINLINSLRLEDDAARAKAFEEKLKKDSKKRVR